MFKKVFVLSLLSFSAYGQNKTVSDFAEAKRLLNKNFGEGRTIYCGCGYEGKKIDYSRCDYEPRRENKRAMSLEWEHVVPAEAFGRNFDAWRNPENYRECNRKGKVLPGRQCAAKVEEKFRLMEADLYNLHPEIGELNGLRSNYSMAEIPGESREFGKCDVEIEDRKFEPREEVKGDVARVYMYMDDSYPGMGIISDKNRKLFEAWSRKDPVSKEEVERAKLIYRLQGNYNRFVLGDK